MNELQKNLLGNGSLLHKQNHPAWIVKPIGGQPCLIAELSDDDLYKKCREYGQNAKEWSRKFAALLPEVAKRGLHRKKGFVSIGEFAGKVAGMSEFAVDKILQLHAKIKDKPALLKLFESGAEGWSKIVKVAYVATVETDKIWAEKVGILSAAALEALVQNYRKKTVPMNQPQNGNLFGQSADAAIDGEAWRSQFEPPVRFSFPASRDLEFDLRVAKQKLEKDTKQTLSWNETFQLIIQKSDLSKGEGTAAQKSTTMEVCAKCSKKTAIFKICEECSKMLGGGGKNG